MTNNDILRRIRYSFDLSDSQMIEVFALAESKVSREQISNWLKQDDDEAFVSIPDRDLAVFLNGIIIQKRGKKEGAPPAVAEEKLTHNIIFRKLKIALNLQADDVLALLANSGSKISKHELSAFFRKPEHKHYRECKDQILRNFLQGLQDKFRGE